MQERKSVFFEDYDTSAEIDVKYLVTKGGSLDVEARITGPDGHVLAVEFQQQSRGGEFLNLYAQTEMAGIHEICFSNKMSRWSKKTLVIQTQTLRSENNQLKEDLAKLKDLGNMVVQLINIENELNSLQDDMEMNKIEAEVHSSLQLSSEWR